MNHDLAVLSDETLVSSIHKLARASAAVEVDLIVHLGEVDARGLYRDRGYPSLHEMCRAEFNFSDDVIYNRLVVARLLRRLPRALEPLREGRIHLTGLRLLASVLNESNCDEVLARAAYKSKKDIELLVAELNPQPTVPDSVRKLPATRHAEQTTTAEPALTPTLALGLNCGPGISASQNLAPHSAPGVSLQASSSGSVAAPAAPEPGLVHAPPRAPMRPLVPLSAEAYKVQFTASRQLKEKLDEARALMRHKVPEGDLATLVEQAMDLLIAKVKKDRFGIGRKPRVPKAAATLNSEALGAAESVEVETVEAEPAMNATPNTNANQSEQTELEADMTSAPKGTFYPFQNGQSNCAKTSKKPSRHIPASVRREVFERDGGRCTFCTDDGVRCGSRDWLEYDHLDGFARTGVHEASRITLRCRAHNQMSAERMYGKAFVESARRRRSGTGESQALLFNAESAEQALKSNGS